jgi:nucleoside-specific channel-forming protein
MDFGGSCALQMGKMMRNTLHAGRCAYISASGLKLMASFLVVFATHAHAADGELLASAHGKSLDADLLPTTEAPTTTDFFSQSISLFASKNIKFGPKPVSDIYAEYEYYGRQGPFELYGYIDVNKVFNIGNKNDHGIWDDGSPIFMEHEPRISIDSLLGKSLAVGPFKEFYLAFDWLYDNGDNKQGRSNVLYSGLGVDIDTHSPVNLAFNFYARRNYENYGLANENSWDGYRAQLEYNAPITTFSDGATLGFIGYTNYDYKSRLPGEYGDAFTDDSLVMANRIAYINKHLKLMLTGYYFHSSSNYANGAELDYGNGPFKANSNGVGYSFSIGYQF